MPFIFVHTGDMPQQAANSGFLGHQTKFGCRSCYVPKQACGNLEYDVVVKGRYHFEAKERRSRGDKIKGIKKRKEFFKSHCLQLEPSPLETLTPALDIISSRSYDIPHSEWKGLGRLLQDLLIEMILAPQGQREYSFLFQQFARPAGWRRIQSPKNHRGSWSLSALLY